MQTPHSPEYIEFVSRLRNARKRLGLSQVALASRLRRHQSFVSKVETCERRIDVIEAVRWCAALGLSIADVLPAPAASDVHLLVPQNPETTPDLTQHIHAHIKSQSKDQRS